MSEKVVGFAPLNNDELTALRVRVWSTQKGRNLASVLSSRREQNLAIHRLLLDAFYDAFLVNPAGKVYIAPRMTEFLETMTVLHSENASKIVKWITSFDPVQYNKEKKVFEINKEVSGKLVLYSITDESQRGYIFWKWAVDTGLSCVENHHELYDIIKKTTVIKITDPVKGIRYRANKIEKCDTCQRRITFLDEGSNRQKSFDVDKNYYILGAHICNGIPGQSVHTISGGAIESNRGKH